ncbi:MAG TPA: thioesterase family protein [Steroidobacteraceae bacterium]
MSAIPIYRTAIAPAWIDYNGHVRDAYYGLMVSLATDSLMDRLGMDAAYRERTRCTLYTLEMHMHFLREVKQTDTVEVAVRILGWDQKRIHAAFELSTVPQAQPAATAEVMLLHVRQDESTGAHPFAAAFSTALQALAAQTGAADATVPGSRRIELRGRK